MRGAPVGFWPLLSRVTWAVSVSRRPFAAEKGVTPYVTLVIPCEVAYLASAFFFNASSCDTRYPPEH